MLELNIKINPGDFAPRYANEVKQLELKTAVITTEGMASGSPLVDLQLVDADGNEYFTMSSGAIFQALAQAIAGAAKRQ